MSLDEMWAFPRPTVSSSMIDAELNVNRPFTERNDPDLDRELSALARRAVASRDPVLGELLVQRLHRVALRGDSVVAARETLRAAYLERIHGRARKLLELVREGAAYESLLAAIDREVLELLRRDSEVLYDAVRFRHAKDDVRTRALMDAATALWACSRDGEFTEPQVTLQKHVRDRLATVMDYLAFLLARDDLEQRLLGLTGAPSLLETLDPAEVERVRAVERGLARAANGDLWRLSSPG